MPEITENEIEQAGIVAEQDMQEEFQLDEEKFDFSKESLQGIF